MSYQIRTCRGGITQTSTKAGEFGGVFLQALDEHRDALDTSSEAVFVKTVDPFVNKRDACADHRAAIKSVNECSFDGGERRRSMRPW